MSPEPPSDPASAPHPCTLHPRPATNEQWTASAPLARWTEIWAPRGPEPWDCRAPNACTPGKMTCLIPRLGGTETPCPSPHTSRSAGLAAPIPRAEATLGPRPEAVYCQVQVEPRVHGGEGVDAERWPLGEPHTQWPHHGLWSLSGLPAPPSLRGFRSINPHPPQLISPASLFSALNIPRNEPISLARRQVYPGNMVTPGGPRAKVQRRLVPQTAQASLPNGQPPLAAKPPPLTCRQGRETLSFGVCRKSEPLRGA